MGLHGKSDWGLQLKKTLYSFDDLSELAVRLGSEVFFDRRGDVVFIDNFENGLGKWGVLGSGDGNEQILTAKRVRSGGYAAKLVGGKTTGYSAQMYIRFPYPVLSKWGIELHCAIDGDMDYISFGLMFSAGTQVKYAYIRYDDVNNKLQYMGNDGQYHDYITNFNIWKNEYLFHAFKLVADFENNKYTRLILNNVTYDLSALDLYVDDVTGEKYANSYITIKSRKDYNDLMYIDNVIVTQNEP